MDEDAAGTSMGKKGRTTPNHQQLAESQENKTGPLTN